MSKLFLFVIYSFLFLCVGGWAIGLVFGVSPFAFFSWETKEVYLNPLSDWIVLYKRFWYENWVVNSPQELAVFFTFLFFFPLYIGLWFWVRKVKWMKKFLKPFSFLHHTKIPTAKTPTSLKSHFERPQALRQTKGFGSVNLPPVASEGKQSVANEEAQNTNARDIEMPPLGADLPDTFENETLSDDLKTQLKELGLRYGFDMFENVLLEDVTVPLVLATDTIALLLTLLTKKREWIADEEVAEDGIEPTWFSAEGLITSPFYLMSKAAVSLKAQEPESEVIPIVVLCDGSILNSGALISQWQSKGGLVALLNDGKAEGLPNLEDVLALKDSSV